MTFATFISDNSRIQEPRSPGVCPAPVLRRARGCLLAALLACGTAGVAAAEAWQPCDACHGANGVAGQAGTPHLNGQLPAFLGEAMRAYADGSRPTSVAQHKTFPADAVAAMAQFYGAQTNAQRPRQHTDAARVGRGEKIYGNRCVDCHGDSGRESDKDAPLVAAQDKEFLAAQTLLFKSGVRKFPFLMDDAYRGLADDDLTAVAEYFAAQEQFAPAGKKKRRR
ncbi:MAG: hypothetical protein HZC24_10925 [Rhodocyclales bacterium]|nr:hypothetical protein [Rhodocyclales bacterium]